ncbi:DNA helicase RecG, partial [bacterium]|nr:DNA helicase RecG [bacterium]
MSVSPTEQKTTPQDSKSALTRSVQYVKGVGPIRAKAFESIGVSTLENLLEYYPRGYLDRRNIVAIRDLHLTEREVTIVGKIAFADLVRGRRGRHRLIAVITDGTGSVQCVWFQGTSYWHRILHSGLTVAASGMVRDYDG